MNERETFSSKLGFVLSCIGSAIGLGNIWMFPWRLGTYGGAAFLIPYLIFVFILGSTGLMEEFALGRSRKKGSFGAIKDILAEKKLPFSSITASIPTLGVTGIFLFYPIVIGWVLKYFLLSVKGDFSNINISSYFNNFAGTQSSILWHGLAISITLVILLLGVINGIEKLNKFAMPTLFILFIILMIRSLTLPGAMNGVKYLLVPNWSYLLQPKTWIMALGQAFFTVSLNGAGMVVYGSYLSDNEDIPSSAVNTVIFDTVAALLAAFIIIPAAFAFGLNPSAGPSLLFITIPSIFKAMPGGYIFGVLFFFSIILASISSAINMLEAPVEAIMGKFKIKRILSVLIVTSVCFIISIPLDLSMKTFGTVADFITIYITPIGAVLSAISFFWIYGIDNALKQINIGAKKPLGKYFKFFAKYVFTTIAILIVIFGIVYGGIG
ncbi:sodium-dependent transporter [Haloimpatiens sp. FM7330]|uniref:sodium-dependent transporter n=1 Tax=Haloimpatiens sp. FM7330 TaxID=3298610 RepID=UPI00363E857D